MFKTKICLSKVISLKIAIAGTIGIVFPWGNPALAQINPDTTLPKNSSVKTIDNITKIENGTESGRNLFHSFQDFSIPTGSTAYFNNATRIKNIISRVTGGSISNIDGLIRTNGTANLFLINPSGIVFGENTRLDIGGSFIASTASKMKFADGSEFNAVAPSETPLLTVSVPMGLQMGSNSGNITVQGDGHLLSEGCSCLFPLTHNNIVEGLQVNKGNTLALISKEINLTGGIIKIPGGNIGLSSVEEGTVKLDNTSQPWQLDISQVQRFGDIKLSDKALVDTSGTITGNIQLQGRNINLEDASTVIIQNSGSQPSGKITVSATDSVKISGSLRNISGVVVSRFITETSGTGKGGDILIKSGNLFVTDGGSVDSISYGNGDTGNIEVDIAEFIKIQNYSQFDPTYTSGLFTVINSKGDAGRIDVSAQNINILDGGVIISTNRGTGKGGDININANEDLKIGGFIPEIASPTTLGSTAVRLGESGSVIINTSILSIFDGAAVGTTTLAEGDAGKVIVNASEYINVSGTVPKLGLISGVQSDAPIFDASFRQILGVPDQPSGDSDNVILNTPSLIVTDGGKISVDNYGLGNSGNLQINTKRIFLDTEGKITAFSTSEQGGNIDLNIEDSLLLRNGGAITAETTATFSNNQSSINGGNININADIVNLSGNSQINANALEGSGGNIKIDSSIIVSRNNSDIIANTVQGSGGNININTQGIFGLKFRDQITPESDITASSQFGINGIVDINNFGDDPSSGLVELNLELADPSQQIARVCSTNNTVDNSFVITGRGGLPQNPRETFKSDQVQVDWATLNPEANSRNHPITIKPRLRKPSKIVEATGWIINQKGEVILTANPINFNIKGYRQLLNTCASTN
ncbi:MAG: S-layer family protein [Cyanobacteria bacterium P01_A01_bin.84]